MMKFLKITLLAAIVLSLTYCTKEAVNAAKKSVEITFTGPKTFVRFTLDTTSIVGSFSKDTTIATINLDSLAKANNASLEDISKVEVKKVTLLFESPISGNFDILDTIQITLTSPTLPSTKIKIADVFNIPAGATSFELPVVPTENLLDVFKQKKIRLYGKLVTNKKIEYKTIIGLLIETTVTAGGTE